MNRRDFSILATTGILSASSLSVAGEKAGSRGHVSRTKTFKAVASADRIICREAPSQIDRIKSPIYSVSSQITAYFTLKKDGSGTSEGGSIRTITGILDPSAISDSLPLYEVTKWTGDFDYEIEGNQVNVYFRKGTSRGSIEEGRDKGKEFVNEYISLSGGPNLIGILSKDGRVIKFHSVGSTLKNTVYADGQRRVGTYSITASGVLID